MLGCDSAATAFASWSKRASASGSAAIEAGKTFTATSRSRRVSWGSINLPHPSRTERRLNLVRAEAAAYLDSHRPIARSPTNGRVFGGEVEFHR
jgi:hypothetical protein